MPHQIAVTIRAPIDEGRADELRKRLVEVGRAGMAGAPFRFDRLPGVHFARFFVLPEQQDLTGAVIPAGLVYLGEVDAPLGRHLANLLDVAGEGVDEVFGYCTGYPGTGASRTTRLRWLRAHSMPADAFYVNTIGRGQAQIRAEATLRAAIEEFLDGQHEDLSDRTPLQIRQEIRAYVNDTPELAWALHPPPRPALSWRAKEALHRFGVPALLLPALPALIVAAPVWAVLLRLHELRDEPDTERPAPEQLQELAELEDLAAQNPFTAVGLVKPGPLRGLTIRLVLSAIDYAVRHHYGHADLAGVKTIHFARWVSMDDRRRVLFASDYDGSLESYMDDFIDKVAWGLNAVFGNGVGYPRTRWLLFGGARDEQAFKYYLRRHQIPTAAWYSAYESLTARNIERNALIRAGLNGEMSPAEAERWLRML
ncbi:hypothetical protein [Actinomadura alba]|uniref:hypothetical protein n=1 Tax=Actinomadura alba TaxID=406431 RepID=UPI001C9C4CC9|nr:hypothetical protein [Actinomadura alba]